VLFYANNMVWKTSNGGETWQRISPDLTRKTWDVPDSVGKYRGTPEAQPTQRGVVYTVAPSPLDVNVVWAGTDDGLIHVTRDGGAHWTDVTPQAQTPWAKVSLIDAGHFDGGTAYAAINTLRLDDLRPHIYRTHDGGKTWTAITNGIPADENTNAVREDPVRRGLLYAGTERGVYVSFDDGDHWQSLRLNLPATSVRDLMIKDNDLAVATHGRGFWILDDVSALRQMNAQVMASIAYLFKPADAYRVRFNMNTDTPLPADEPMGQNPPDGAIIDYWLKSDSSGPVTLEILDGAGAVIRRYSSDERPEIDPNPPVPAYWYRAPQVLSSSAGVHRFVWDMHYAPLPGASDRLPIAATPHDTVPAPSAPWVNPGQYSVRLMADGQSLTQPIVVKMDPRVKTPVAGLTQQFTLSKQMYDGARELRTAIDRMDAIRKQVADRRGKAQGPVAQALATFDQHAEALAGSAGFGFGRGGGGGADTLSSVAASLTQTMNQLQSADRAPTTVLAEAVRDREAALTEIRGKWTAFQGELKTLNAQLQQAGLQPITIE
jgi:hypothetical protein